MVNMGCRRGATVVRLLALESLNAIRTNKLSLELCEIFGIVTETARVVVFLENYARAFYIKFYRIAVLDIHNSATFLGNNNSSKFIDMSYDTDGFHSYLHS